MTTGPRSEYDIARNEHNYDLDAKDVNVVGDITNVPDGAESGVYTLTGSYAEIGGKAGSRSVGIQIVSRSESAVYISTGTNNPSTEAYIEDNEGLFLPTNLSVYIKGTVDDTVVYWEL